MAETVSVHIPFVDVRREGDKWSGYITQPWFRYLINSNPDGFGTGTGVLHGNPSGAPTWGPVDLTTDTSGKIDLTSQVSGQLPVANGGLGGISATIGGVLYFPTATSVASSSALALNQVVVGGGASGPSTVSSGIAHQVLHANGPFAPFWQSVHLDADVTGTLPVVNGGTGTIASTGTGAVVLDSGCTISPLSINGGTWTSAKVSGSLFWATGTVPTSSQLDSNDSALTSVTGGPVTIIANDGPMFWVVFDKTSGGMAIGTMDTIAGIHVISTTLTSITLTRGAGAGLQATVTGGTATRSLSAWSVLTGPP